MSVLTAEPESSIKVEEDYETSSSQPDSAHIVMVPTGEEDETPQAYVMRARIEGFPIVALCGFTWVPYRSAEGLPVCQACLDVYHQDGENREDRNELPDE